MKLRKYVSDNLDYLRGAELGPLRGGFGGVCRAWGRGRAGSGMRALGQAEVGDGAGRGGPLCCLHPYGGGGTIITNPNLAESAGRG